MSQPTHSPGSHAELLSDPRFLAISAISVVGAMGTNILSPALPSIAARFGISDARVGLIMTTYQMSGMVAIPAAGVLADLYGRRYVVLPSLFLLAAAGTSVMVIDTFAGLLVACALLGTAFAGTMPLSITLIGDLYSGATGAAAQGMRTGANGIGSIVFPLLTGILVGVGWKYPFLLFAVGFLVLVLAYASLPETVSARESDKKGSTFRRYGHAVHTEMTQADLATLVTGGFIRDFARYALLTFVPLFGVRMLGANFAEAGAIVSVRGVAYLVVSPVAGLVVERLSRKTTLLGALTISAASIAAIPFSPTILWLGLAIGVYSVGDALLSPVLKDLVADTATDAQRGGIVGILNIMKNGGKAAAPVVFGTLLALRGFDIVFFGATSVLVAYGATVALTVDPNL